MCCSQKRSVLRSHTAPAIPSFPVRPTASQPVSRPGDHSSARVGVPAPRSDTPLQFLSMPATLHYLKDAPIRVRGAVSGRQYDFSRSRPAQPVDRRDLPGLLRTGLFRQS